MILTIPPSPQVLSLSPFLFFSLPYTLSYQPLPCSPKFFNKPRQDCKMTYFQIAQILTFYGIINLGLTPLQSCHFFSLSCRNWDLSCLFKLFEVDKMVQKTERQTNIIITWFLLPGEIKLNTRDLLCGNKSDEHITQVSFFVLLFNSLTLTRKQERDRFTIGTVWNGHLYIVPMCSPQSHR